ncbi:MAG: PAS domain-containing protein [Deltaproteobacteria bacterium]|nr:PAS domain-containing protein [Deltaproteobacteria bacterium]
MAAPSNLDKWIQKNLFDVVPTAIAVINLEFDLVYANKAFEEMFGPWQEKKCYSVYKNRDSVCVDCKGAKAFKDGMSCVNEEVGYDKNGKLTQYIKHTVPVADEHGNIQFLIEMSTDVTETERMRKERQLLFDQVPCNILLIDRDFHIVRTNKSVRKIFGDIEGKYCYETLKGLDHQCSECTARQSFSDGKMHTGLHVWKSNTGEEIYSQVTTVPLDEGDGKFGLVMEMAVDITQTVKLEDEKLEAERLAAVGQTVAGLAHGVKNLITGLEGGMYMLNSGMKKSNVERIQKGMEMLGRNIGRVSTFVREFLSFSKGRKIKAKLGDPAKIAAEVVDLYAEKAKELGIEIINEKGNDIPPAHMDSEGIHECLTNLVGNAIDACRMSDDTKSCHVWVRTLEKDGTIIYEVIDDGCGMDYEVKQKVFTNFFTTKGLGGTGLGLLMTKKIVQEHGGRIDLESEPGKGTTFRILLHRKRLPKP